MPRPYQQQGLVLRQGASGDFVKALQRDLRALGYLRRGIDGAFGPGTARALKSLTYDLLHNDGATRGGDGRAPVALKNYNRGRVAAVADSANEALAACIDDLLADDKVTKVPRSDNAAAENQIAIEAIETNASKIAPTAFILAMAQQESGRQHYCVPIGNDEDSFVVVGLDYGDDANPDRITSRGYGIGQATLFHHPPRPDELENLIVDPVGNVTAAYVELREKFDRMVAGPDDTADDRKAEHPKLSMRLCAYPMTDARYMNDCASCARKVPSVDIRRGTPVYPGASYTYQPAGPYRTADYGEVPNRAAFLCDWPYAARRYNGGGLYSFHYQSIILRNLRAMSP